MKKKVYILQNGLALGGTDTFVVNICRGLNKQEFDVVVINPSIKPESLIREPEIIATGCKILRTSPLTTPWSKLKHFYRLYQILRKGKADIFHTNVDLFNGPQLFIAWLARVPIRICHSHNGNQQKALVHGQTLMIRVYQSLMRWMCWTFSNRRLGCSAIAMDFLYKGYDWQHDKYPIIINNGIDLDIYKKQKSPCINNNELGLSARYNIVTVGRIIPQKNPLFIANVFVELCKNRTDCDFVWVGDGILKQECEEIFRRANLLSRVHFLGQRSDVPDILQCCDMFFMPSSFEGLGIVLIEAQAAGLPCLVSTAVPNEANCGGCLYKSLDDSLESWASILGDILDNVIILKSNDIELQKFSINYMVEQMQRVFKS